MVATRYDSSKEIEDCESAYLLIKKFENAKQNKVQEAVGFKNVGIYCEKKTENRSRTPFHCVACELCYQFIHRAVSVLLGVSDLSRASYAYDSNSSNFMHVER